MVGECPKSEIGYSTRPAFGIGEPDLIRKKPENPFTSSKKGLLCVTNVSLFENKLIDTSLMDEISDHTDKLTKCFTSDSLTIGCKRLPVTLKKIEAKTSSHSSPRTMFPLTEKYIPSLSYHHASVRFKCPVETSIETLLYGAPLLCSTLTIQYRPNRLHPKYKGLKSESSSWLPCVPRISSQSYSQIRRQTKPKRSRDTCGVSCKARAHGLCKVSAYRGLRHPIPQRRAHLRGFHSTTVPHNKSNSDKPTDCREMNKICETAKDDDCGKPCEKKDACRQEKIKCEKPEQRKEAPKKEPEKPLCRDTCLPMGKCEVPNVDPPPKMTYKKVTCPPSKFAKLASCPPFQEGIKKEDIEPRTGINMINKKKKKKVCPPVPLPKPPYAPIFLCPCPPPPKIHPGACPCYEHKSDIKQLMLSPCPSKKPYPCPTDVHYCPPKKCEKVQACEKDRPNIDGSPKNLSRK